MKKQLICILLSLIVLSGCSGKGSEDSNNGTGTDTRTPVTAGLSDTGTEEDPANTAAPSVNKETETVDVTIPSIPEEGVPYIFGDVIYTNDNIIAHKGVDGTTYVNGQPVSTEEYDKILMQIVLNSLAERTSTNSPSVSTPGDAKEPAVTVKPSVSTTPKVTETPDETVFNEEDDPTLGVYVSTGKTDLSITDIKIFSNAKPGVTDIKSFKPGDTMLINIWCNSIARLESTLYIVPKTEDHKDSYKPNECLESYSMFTSFETETNQIFLEAKLPSSVKPGIYELRFVCGTEEGYIPFYIG